MRNGLKVVWLLAGVFLVSLMSTVVMAFQDGVTAGGDSVAVVDAPRLTSVGAVIIFAIVATKMTTNIFGNTKWFGEIPIWIYTTGWVIVFTVLANLVFKTLPGSIWMLLWSAIYNSASASGFYSWFSNGITQPMKASEVVRKAGVFFLIAALVSSTMACGGQQSVPQLPSSTPPGDAAAVIARAYQDIGGALLVLQKAEAYEATLNRAGSVPATVHAQFNSTLITIVQSLDTVNTQIQSKVLTTYQAVVAKVNPILAQLNTLLAITKQGGFNWSGLLSAGIELLMDIAAPGFGGSGGTDVYLTMGGR